MGGSMGVWVWVGGSMGGGRVAGLVGWGGCGGRARGSRHGLGRAGAHRGGIGTEAFHGAHAHDGGWAAETHDGEGRGAIV